MKNNQNIINTAHIENTYDQTANLNYFLIIILSKQKNGKLSRNIELSMLIEWLDGLGWKKPIKSSFFITDGHHNPTYIIFLPLSIFLYIIIV